MNEKTRQIGDRMDRVIVVICLLILCVFPPLQILGVLL